MSASGAWTLRDKEEKDGSRLDYVVAGSPPGGDRPAIPVPCYLTQQCRIRHSSHGRANAAHASMKTAPLRVTQKRHGGVSDMAVSSGKLL